MKVPKNNLARYALLAGLAFPVALYVTQARQTAPIQNNLEQAVNETEANQFLEAFPDQFPVAHVDKYKTPDAKYCLVHIVQNHLPIQEVIYQLQTGFNKKTDLASQALRGKTLQDAIRVNAVQRDIYDILVQLETKEVFEEGLIQGRAMRPENALGGHVRILDLLGQAGYLNPAPLHDYLDALIERKNPPAAILEQAEEFRYAPGAVIALTMEGKISPIPVDKKEWNDQFNEALANARSDEVAREFAEKRKTHLLERMAERGKPVAITVYGQHSFGGKESFSNYRIRSKEQDTIACWNEKNPDKKISLIEVYPYSLGR